MKQIDPNTHASTSIQALRNCPERFFCTNHQDTMCVKSKQARKERKNNCRRMDDVLHYYSQCIVLLGLQNNGELGALTWTMFSMPSSMCVAFELLGFGGGISCPRR